MVRLPGQDPGDRGRQLHHPERCGGQRDGLGRRGQRRQHAVGGQPEAARRRHQAAASPACAPTARNIYGSGFAFGTGQFEGSFAADPSTGNIIWANDCHGDTYDSVPIGQVLYTVSHAHNCSQIGGFFQSDPWATNMRHALAFTTYPTGHNVGVDDYGWDYTGVPSSTPAALVPRAGSRCRHGPEPGRLVGHGQQQVPRARW